MFANTNTKVDECVSTQKQIMENKYIYTLNRLYMLYVRICFIYFLINFIKNFIHLNLSLAKTGKQFAANHKQTETD